MKTKDLRKVCNYRYKVPFRQVYCATFKDFIKETIWCLFVIRIFPKAHDFGSDGLKDYYKRNKGNMYEQLSFLIEGEKNEY